MYKCYKCGEMKERDEFYRDSSKSSGYRSICKECDKKRPKKYNRERALVRYHANKEELNKYQREWYQKNKDTVIQKQKAYRDANPEREVLRHKRYREMNRDKLHLMELQRNLVRQRDIQEYRLKKYGLTVDDFNQLLKKQNGRCAICGTRITFGVGKHAVDHDHVTSKVRGILCGYCNVALGLVQDNMETLQNMIEYLHRNRKEDNDRIKNSK